MKALGETQVIRPRKTLRSALAALDALEEFHAGEPALPMPSGLPDVGGGAGAGDGEGVTGGTMPTALPNAPGTDELDDTKSNQGLLEWILKRMPFERDRSEDKQVPDSVRQNKSPADAGNDYSEETLGIMRQALRELSREDPQPIFVNLAVPDENNKEQSQAVESYLKVLTEALQVALGKKELPEIIVNVPDQPPPNIEVNVPKQPTPNVNVQAKVDLPVEETIDVEKGWDGMVERFTKRRKFSE